MIEGNEAKEASTHHGGEYQLVAQQQQRYAYYRAILYPGVTRRLMVVALLGVIAGCGVSSSPLPSGVVPVVDSDAAYLWPADQLNSANAPACAQIDEPTTSTHLAMYRELNRYRVENGLQPLLYSKTLESAIEGHVEDLWVRSFFSHTNPDGEDPGDRAVRAGFCHWYVGENIAAGQPTVQRVMVAWERSPSHNENMLVPDFVYVGMGHFVDPTGRHYWGQLLAFEYP